MLLLVLAVIKDTQKGIYKVFSISCYQKKHNFSTSQYLYITIYSLSLSVVAHLTTYGTGVIVYS